MPKLSEKTIVLLVILFSVCFVSLLWFLNQKNSVGIPSSIGCTEEVKICPDSSTVGRSGINCEFTPCLESSTNSNISDWKTYQQNYFNFRYPPDFVSQPEQRYDDRYQQDFFDSQNEYVLSIVEYPNFNQKTSKPYVDEDEFIGLNYPQDKLIIGNRIGTKVCPRASCEDMFDVIFSTDIKKSFYALSLQVGNHNQLVPEEELKKGKQVFTKILSTFKFTKQ